MNRYLFLVILLVLVVPVHSQEQIQFVSEPSDSTISEGGTKQLIWVINFDSNATYSVYVFSTYVKGEVANGTVEFGRVSLTLEDLPADVYNVTCAIFGETNTIYSSVFVTIEAVGGTVTEINLIPRNDVGPISVVFLICLVSMDFSFLDRYRKVNYWISKSFIR